MPMGDYTDFADCVSQNQGKDDPEAYCAAIKRAIEESAPNPASPLVLPFQLVADICPACAVKMQQMKMTVLKISQAADFSKITAAIRARFSSSYQAMKTRSVSGVEIFKVGTHTDSAGQSRQWSSADLGALALSKATPLKVGHTSDAFNAHLADQLGVPLGIMLGEKGKGAARFGSVVNLRLHNDTLLADFNDVPDPLADFIEGGQFNAVSVEIGMLDDKPVLTAVALLGSESPAVQGLKTLDLAHFSDGGSNRWVILQLKDDASALVMKDFNPGGLPMFDRKTKDKPQFNFTAEDVAQLYTALQLDPTAAVKDVLDAIGILLRKDQDDILPAAVTQLQAQVTKQAEYITRLEHRDRVTQYAQKALKWTAVPGKPEELGEKLELPPLMFSTDDATALVAAYQSVQDAADQVGLMSPLGTSRVPNLGAETKDAFQDEMDQWAADNKDTDPSKAKTLAHFATTRPNEFRQYRQRVRQAVHGA